MRKQASRVFAISIFLLGCVAQGGYTEFTKLTATDASSVDELGVAVDLDGNIGVVGAQAADPAGKGAAYIFDVTTGAESWKITPFDGAGEGAFGFSVAISGDKAIVGAYLDDDVATRTGSAYVYDLTTSNLINKLTAPDVAAFDWFGYDVDLWQDTAIIGARYDDDMGPASGSVYIYDVMSSNLINKLTAPDGGLADSFGISVAIYSNLAVVGASQDDDKGVDAGAAYVFDATSSNLLFKLTAPDGGASDLFGEAVALEGNIAIIGAQQYDGATADSGAAYVFDITTSNLLYTLESTNTTSLLGQSVALYGNTAVVGADNNEVYVFDLTTGDQAAQLVPSDATGQFGISVSMSGTNILVGANNDSDNGFNAGAAYVFSEQDASVYVVPTSLVYTATCDGASPASQLFSITNAGSVTFDYTNSWTYGAGATNWLTITPTNGTLTAGSISTNTAMVSIVGLTAGTYYATNIISASPADNSPQTQTITLTVNPANQTITIVDPGVQVITNIVPLIASASSGLTPVTFSVLSGPGMITATNILSFSGAGLVEVQAVQAGDACWLPATNSIFITVQVGALDVSPLALNYTAECAGTNPVDQSFAITNTGPISLSYSNSVTYGAGATGWLTLTPLTGTLASSQGVSVSAAVDITGLTSGVYYATNLVYSPVVTNTPLVQVITLTVSQTAQTISITDPGTQMTNDTVTLNASASSGLTPVTFSVFSGPGSIAGGTNLSFTAPGTVVIEAVQAGDTCWAAATNTLSIIVTGGTCVSAAVLDFDGDGKSDLATYTETSGMWNFRTSSSGDTSSLLGFPGTKPVSGDFDDDGTWDYGVYYAPNGNWYLLQTTGGFTSTAFGFDPTEPVSADFDGDGKFDTACYYAPDGLWYGFNSSGGFWTTQFGFSDTRAIAGDFDGDDIDDYGVYYEPIGYWFVYQSAEGFWATVFGYAGTVPVTGDFDGDGIDDFGCYYAPDGWWYIYKSTEGFWVTQFGFAGTTPVVGDFDGDCSFDYGVYHPDTGNWYIQKSTDGFYNTEFGSSGSTGLRAYYGN